MPVTGEPHAKRSLQGVLNIQSGEVLWFITDVGHHEAHQAFWRLMRRPWRGWPLGLFEDRGSPQTAAASLRQAKALRIAVRFRPRATPELKAMDHLWRHVKGRGLATRATASMDKAADDACQYWLAMRRRERLQKAGVLSGNFWLTT